VVIATSESADLAAAHAGQCSTFRESTHAARHHVRALDGTSQRTVSTSAAKPLAPTRLRSVANVVVSQLNTAIVSAGSFVVTPAVLYGLGDSGYGGWLLITSFISYMRLLDLGTSAGTIKYGAGAQERGDTKGLASVMNTSAAIFLGIGVAATAITLGLTVLFRHVYPEVAGGQTFTILTLGGAMVIDLCLRPFTATLRMRSLHFVHDTIEIGSYAVFKLGFVLYFAYAQLLSYRVLALLTLGETATRMLLVVVAALVVSPVARRINPLRAEKAMVRKLANMGFAVSIVVVADIVRFQLDAGVIGYFMPTSPESISIFGVGIRLASLAFSVLGVIGGTLMPRFSGLQAIDDNEGTNALLVKASRVTGFASSFLLVNLAVIGPHFLALWLRKPWIATSAKVLLIVLPAYYIALLSVPAGVLLMARGRLRGLTILTVTEAVANLTLSVLLVRPLGVIGVALGTAIPLALFRGIFFPFLLEAEVGLSPANYARMHARPVLVGALYLVLVGGLAYVPLPTYARLVGVSLLSTFVFAGIAIAFVPEARAQASRLRPKR
jgi:O-antigen/teichoic acid export membrane protein